MSYASATLFTPSEVGKLLTEAPLGDKFKQPRASLDRASLVRLAAMLDVLTAEVKSGWSELPAEVRDALTNLAYLETRHMSPARRVWSYILGLVEYLRDAEGMLAFAAARSRLVDAVFSEIERENDAFQSDLRDMLADLELDEMVGAPLEPGRAREYLNNL